MAVAVPDPSSGGDRARCDPARRRPLGSYREAAHERQSYRLRVHRRQRHEARRAGGARRARAAAGRDRKPRQRFRALRSGLAPDRLEQQDEGDAARPRGRDAHRRALRRRRARRPHARHPAQRAEVRRLDRRAAREPGRAPGRIRLGDDRRNEPGALAAHDAPEERQRQHRCDPRRHHGNEEPRDRARCAGIGARGGARRRLQGSARRGGGEPGEIDLPRDDEPRNPHADERRARHARSAGARPTRRPPAHAGAPCAAIGHVAAQHHRRRARLLQDRSGAARA